MTACKQQWITTIVNTQAENCYEIARHI